MVDQSSGGTDAGEREARETDASLVDMAKAVDVAFPKLRCLRCGSESFYLIASRIFEAAQRPSLGAFNGDAVDLVCQRCGMIERHLWKILRDAAKPIDTD
ncbi:hypothetical protein MSC49_00200 [Methylosinus sp. C49]|nr:hypothetical protein MSC49_00200 [Methylosinus sp. C49]